MNIKVNLKDIIEEMEMQLEESHSFLNLKTGEILSVTSDNLRAAEDEEPFDHLADWEIEDRISANDVIEDQDNYLELPSGYEVNEYELTIGGRRNLYCGPLGERGPLEGLTIISLIFN
ncbi:hypothetical protein [Mesobacillus foraminis]|uniref:Uncharacterized protein n=1 Tax=Mesobacillus foraminis TaxID=279826 RepID=A0A4V2RDX5_9BACI|nr:hypothetical protein [Mesobacillus foraminis]TCN26520.1 hypothetical protein EV146_10341 [Mesobacillus foraminis]